jgi:hypothetical protein
MTRKTTMKPLAAAFGAALATSLISIPAAIADENPFGMSKLSSGYMVADSQSGLDLDKASSGRTSKLPPPHTSDPEAASGTDLDKASSGKASKEPRPAYAPTPGDSSGTDIERQTPK